jgi:hypothetical protein
MVKTVLLIALSFIFFIVLLKILNSYSIYKNMPKYVDNDEFEKILMHYKRHKDSESLAKILAIFNKMINSVYNMAIRNIYNNITPGNFPLPNYHDREDLKQTSLLIVLNAIKYWKPAHKEKRKKSKAFNYFTCCIVYGIQNELKKELRKGWHKSPVLAKNYLRNYAIKLGLNKIPIDYDEIKKFE